MSLTAGPLTTNYTWDAVTGRLASGLPVVLQDGTNTYVYGLDLISATDGAGVETYHLYDGLGSTTDLTDGSGNVVAGYSYDVFGAIRSQIGTGDTDFKFTGEQLDSDSSFYYLRARYYDPAIGRFLGQDPIPSQNLYAYVGNNPTNFTDPLGTCPGGCESQFQVPSPRPQVSVPLLQIFEPRLASGPPTVDCDEQGDIRARATCALTALSELQREV